MALESGEPSEDAASGSWSGRDDGTATERVARVSDNSVAMSACCLGFVMAMTVVIAVAVAYDGAEGSSGLAVPAVPADAVVV